MPQIVDAVAFANNEVAFIAWQASGPIPGLLGFHIVREYLDAEGRVTEERPLASYVAFRGQRNPSGQPQNTSVWPVQKFTWRDLTLRKRRDAARRRPEAERVRWRLRAVGRFQRGLEPVLTVPEGHRDAASGAWVEHTYEGKPLRLGYLTPPAWTNDVEVTAHRPPFFSTFTNGILSTQFLLRVLKEDGVLQEGELETHLKTPRDWLRNYLAGDVLPLMHGFFARRGGRFHAALYELEDEELLRLLELRANRLELILSDAGSGKGDDEDGDGSAATLYDTRNAPARARLQALADKPRSKFRLQHRMFNGTGHIGHHKFVVHVDDAGNATSVLTGSTNWTWSGVAGQSNNCIRIDDSATAAAYLACWQRLRDDPQPMPVPPSARATGNHPRDALKQAHGVPHVSTVGGATIETWFSPNVPGKNQPPAANAKKPSPPPPDMARLFSLMRQARRAIFFLVFMPSRGGLNSIVAEAVALGQKDPTLDVIGAISDTQAMWGYVPGGVDDSTGQKIPAKSPHVFVQGGVSVVRATALTDREIGRELGDFKFDETLTTGRAIIHDKILVLDPADPVGCTVVFGSHNLGHKASYANDENLVIVRGHQPLALAYTAHVLDVYDHYRFRAAEAQQTDERAAKRWDGFLSTRDSWQRRASQRMARYFTSMAG